MHISFKSMVATAAILAVTSLASANAQDMRLAGSWVLSGPAPTQLKATDGSEAPYTAQARALLAERLAAGPAGDAVETACLPPGIPRLMTTEPPFTVLITPSKVTILHEFQHTIRHIHLNEDMPAEEDIDPFFGGTSVGRWDGNALVVTTGRFNDQIRLDAAGSPQSENAVITERFEVSADGSSLTNSISVNDPANYTRPWTATLSYNRSDVVQLKEDVCAYKLLAPSLRAQVDAPRS